MVKIKSLFVRNFEDKNCPATQVVTEGCEWVLDGEGKPYRKLDGTSCLIKNGKLFKRFDCKKGRFSPEGFIPCQEPDPITGHWPGWVMVGDGPEDKYHRGAVVGEFSNNELKKTYGSPFDSIVPDGTYELIGPKINGNRENVSDYFLINHKCPSIAISADEIAKNRITRSASVYYLSVSVFLKTHIMEGIVWHRENGDMVKIKRSDFGYNWL